MKESKPKEARELPETTSIIGMVPVERMKISRIGASEYIKELTDKRDEYFKSCISWLDKYEALDNQCKGMALENIDLSFKLKESERLRERYRVALEFCREHFEDYFAVLEITRQALAEDEK